MDGNQSRLSLRSRSAGGAKKVKVLWSGSILMCVLAFGLSWVGCSTDHKQNADELREKTAETTAELKQNAKSVAEGVKEGWNRDKDRVDLNTATREQLVGTGLTRTQSDHVIEHRPYANPRELLTRHILSEDEYKAIEPRLRAGGASEQ
jgi:hypothetical protein